MRKLFAVLLLAGVGLYSCNNKQKAKEKTQNPFFAAYNTPFETPNFDKIKFAHFEEAFTKGLKEASQDINAIANNTAAPTFENTIEAMDKAGQLLNKVNSVFDNITSANVTDELRALSKKITPKLTSYYASINMNDKLFKRVKTLFDKQNQLNLTQEQKTLLDKTYKQFVRGGANLSDEKKLELKKINDKLALLTLQFGENLLNDNNAFELVITDKKNLAGLPEGVIAAAAETAKERNKAGKWVFTLDKPSMIPFLQYAKNRDLRKKLYDGYVNRGNNNNKNNNQKLIVEITNLRLKKANILGFKNYAAYILNDNMAKTPERAEALLNKLWKPALANAKKEAKALQQIINKEGGKFKLAPSDWWYYTEKLKKAKYDLDESQLRPYFELNNVRSGAFQLANKLYGLQFKERNDITKYHPDVQTWEVLDANGKHVGIFYLDYHPRASKQGGAWMNSYRKQSHWGEKNAITPIICNVCNFTKPVGDKPALLSVDEVETLFHEFGHALHGFLSQCKYNTLSGTAVSRDFVEFPSQVMENWCFEPEMLNIYAKHYKTGEIIPIDLVKKLKRTAQFNQGFATTEYLAAAMLDMQYQTLTKPLTTNVNKFEKDYLNKIGLIPEIYPRYRSTYFAHIFSGGYAAGYYAYIWAAVLDSDTFQAFKETGLFNKDTAEAFRKNILSRGGTDDPMKLYKQFRGAEPSETPLLIKRGLKK